MDQWDLESYLSLKVHKDAIISSQTNNSQHKIDMVPVNTKAIRLLIT